LGKKREAEETEFDSNNSKGNININNDEIFSKEIPKINFNLKFEYYNNNNSAIKKIGAKIIKISCSNSDDESSSLSKEKNDSEIIKINDYYPKSNSKLESNSIIENDNRSDSINKNSKNNPSITSKDKANCNIFFKY